MDEDILSHFVEELNIPLLKAIDSASDVRPFLAELIFDEKTCHTATKLPFADYVISPETYKATIKILLQKQFIKIVYGGQMYTFFRIW